MSGGQPDEAELFAFDVLEGWSGAEVIPTDVRGAPPRTIDARLKYTDGRLGAVEVTRLATTEQMRLDAYLRQHGRQLPAPGNWSWEITINDARERPGMLEHYAEVITLLEAYEAQELNGLPPDLVSSSAALRWATQTSVRFFGIPMLDTQTPPANPRVWLSRSMSAVWDAKSDPIGEAVHAALQTEHVQDKLAKLLPVEADERHLFLVFAEGGVSNAAYMAIVIPEMLPRTDPDAPEGLSHIWVTSGAHPVLLWTHPQGWTTLADLAAS